MYKNQQTKPLSALLFLLAVGCSQAPTPSVTPLTPSQPSPTTLTVTGNVVTSGFATGGVVAIGSLNKNIVSSTITNGSFSLALPADEYQFFLGSTDSGGSLEFQESANSPALGNRLIVTSPQGASINLGDITIQNGLAAPANNPVGQGGASADTSGTIDVGMPINRALTTSVMCFVPVRAMPLPGENDVDPNDEIAVSFCSAIDPVTFGETTFVVTNLATSAVIDGTLKLSNNGKTARFIPSKALTAGATYQVTLNTTLLNATGHNLGAQVSYPFTVYSTSTANTADFSLQKISPLNGAGFVALDRSIVATFNLPLDPKTVILASGDFQVQDSKGANVPGKLTLLNDHTVLFTPTANFAPNSTFSWTVGSSVAALSSSTSGTAALGISQTFTFMTGSVSGPNAQDVIDDEDFLDNTLASTTASLLVAPKRPRNFTDKIGSLIWSIISISPATALEAASGPAGFGALPGGC